MKRGRILTVVPLVCAVAFAACEEVETVTPCSNIPAGGCPIARGLSCSDPACEAVYACREGNVWELERRCPPHDAGEAGAPADAAQVPVFDAAFDAPPGAFGGPGCGSLQSPDCPLGVGLACGPDCCGCEDLFVCEGGGWTHWGVCTESGPTPASAR